MRTKWIATAFGLLMAAAGASAQMPVPLMDERQPRMQANRQGSDEQQLEHLFGCTEKTGVPQRAEQLMKRLGFSFKASDGLYIPPKGHKIFLFGREVIAAIASPESIQLALKNKDPHGVAKRLGLTKRDWQPGDMYDFNYQRKIHGGGMLSVIPDAGFSEKSSGVMVMCFF